MAQLNYSDFYQVPDLKFDIKKLREDLDKVLTKYKGIIYLAKDARLSRKFANRF